MDLNRVDAVNCSRSRGEGARDRLLSQCKTTIDAFQCKVLPCEWAPRGILVSEGLAFCAMADAFGVDLVIESGVYDGRSSEIWARYFDAPQAVYAVDRELRGEAVRRLQPYEVELVEGAAEELLPQLLDRIAIDPQHAQRNIAVFIDGPKGSAAIALAKRCLEYQRVCFVGIHDVHQQSLGGVNATRTEFDQWDDALFCTDDEDFVRSYAWLDASDSRWDVEQGIRWVPYELLTRESEHERKLGSYGPTIGFAFNKNLELG